MDAVVQAYDGNVQMIDSFSVRVHQHVAGAKEGGPGRCMGRSRGGLTTKIHLVVDATGLPIRKRSGILSITHILAFIRVLPQFVALLE